MEQDMASQGGYNAANMVTEQEYARNKKSEALEQLATATIADWEAMSNLAHQISANNSTAEALVKLQEQITVLAQQVQDMASDGRSNNNKRNNGQRVQKRSGNKISCYYCWNHGLGYNQKHTSKTCFAKATGHKDNAHFGDMMGDPVGICKPEMHPIVRTYYMIYSKRIAL